MRKKQLILALVFMVALGLASWLTRDTDKSGDVRVGDLLFGGIDSNKVNRIIVDTPNQAMTELILDKKKWVVKNRFNMDADPSLIRKTKTLIDKAKAVHVIQHDETDLDLFALDVKSSIKIKIYSEGSDEPEIYRFGKLHAFQKEGSGRYVYIENKKSIVLIADNLLFISGQPSIWLKKYVPHHEQVAGISLYYQGTVLWKTDRNRADAGFQLVLPKNSNQSAEKTKQLMFYAMQMRYMDITPAINDFEPEKEYTQVQLYYHTFAGRTYKLGFLKPSKDKRTLRCRLSIIPTKSSTEFIKSYGDEQKLIEELSEWHFIIPFDFYQKLFAL